MKHFYFWFLSLLAPMATMAETHEYVDLGLPSKTLWATTNIGASSPEGFGYYFAWGETTTKSTYSWSNYQYCSGTSETVQDLGTTISGTKYDAARANWGSEWQMPTYEQINELVVECGLEVKTYNGVKCMVFIGPNGNTLYFPCPGYKYDSYYVSQNSITYYWGGSKDIEGNNDAKATALYIKNGSRVESTVAQRRTGLPIRPVRSQGNVTPDPEAPTPEAIDLGLSVKWASFNLGATSAEKYGNLYAWGETATKSSYTWANYQHASGTAATVKDIGNDISGTNYDAATTLWGSDWRIPTKSEITELCEKCTFTAATVNGVNGYNVKGPSGKTIFIPLAGCSYDGKSYGSGSYSYYWSGDISTSSNQKAYSLYLKAATAPAILETQRRTGIFIRPVKGEKQPETIDPNPQQLEMVDLGLSVKWANQNIDATLATEYGKFYAWGETTAKSTYTWANYTLCNGSAYTSQNIGTNISQSETYDVAYKRNNKTMCIPTNEHWQELINQCTWVEKTENNVKGYRVTGPNGNSIFLPYAGCSYDGKNFGIGSYSYYWTANNVSNDISKAQAAYLKSGSKATIASLNRRTGIVIRPVEAVEEPNGQPQAHTWNIEAVDLGLSVEWCNSNIGGNKIENEECTVDFFAWGEKKTKSTYTWANYAYCNGTSSSMINIGSDISGTQYDAAASSDWGQNNTWRMPTVNEMNELLTKCTFSEGEEHGVSGYHVTGPNGNSIFLPFVGCSYDGNDYGIESYSYIWTSGIDPTNSQKAKALYISSNNTPTVTSCRRRTGAAIRPVKPKTTPVNPTVNHPYVVLSGTTLTFYYDNKEATRTGTKYGLNNGTNFPEWYTDGSAEDITTVVFDTSFAEARPTTCYAWFLMMSKLTRINGLSFLNTSEVTDMEGMFAYCANITSIDVSHFDTSKVTDMNAMFSLCYKLTDLDVSQFNTSNVTDMGCMFMSCLALRNLDLSSFDTSKVTSMGSMFQDCPSLMDIDLSSFETNNVTFMGTMFMDCSSLQTLDLSTFTFKSGVTTTGMLSNCSALTRLTIPSTAGRLQDKACTKIGTSAKPCLLIFPEGFTPEKSATGSNFYVWKNGYFYDNHEEGSGENQGGNQNEGGQGNTPDSDAEFVDLGLPSGKLWATCNVGATSPEGTGGYYAWGEIEPKNSYTWENYKWEIDEANTDATLIGVDDIGGIPTLDPSCGKTIVHNGKTFLSRMPSYDDIQELFKNCTRTEENLNGVTVYKMVSKNNGNTFYLPLLGSYYDSYKPSTNKSSSSYFWVSTISASDNKKAWSLFLKGNSEASLSQCQRRTGMQVRAIYYPNGNSQLMLSPSGINNIDNHQFIPENDDAIYTLQGIKVEGKLQPGIYIQKGRKFVVK